MQTPRRPYGCSPGKIRVTVTAPAPAPARVGRLRALLPTQFGRPQQFKEAQQQLTERREGLLPADSSAPLLKQLAGLLCLC